jgi:hypothetical protein
MKKLFFLLLIFASSCLDDTKTLPNSTGSFSEVIFVVEDDLWQESIKEVVAETFGAPIEGLNQDEASFRIVQVNHAEFKSILKMHKNIVIIAKDVKASSQKNKWANAQLVVQLNYEKKNIKNNLNKIKAIFELEEVRGIKNKIATTSQQLPQQNIYQNFKIKLLIPSEYIIIKDTSTFFWATYNPEKQEVIKQLLVFSFIPKATSLQQEVLQKTDSIFAQYLHGTKQGQYVTVEPNFYPFKLATNTYGGRWKLEKGFMGGPFLMKTYFVNEKIVVAVGLVFDPSSRKRKYLKTFEAIL